MSLALWEHPLTVTNVWLHCQCKVYGGLLLEVNFSLNLLPYQNGMSQAKIPLQSATRMPDVLVHWILCPTYSLKGLQGPVTFVICIGIQISQHFNGKMLTQLDPVWSTFIHFGYLFEIHFRGHESRKGTFWGNMNPFWGTQIHFGSFPQNFLTKGAQNGFLWPNMD